LKKDFFKMHLRFFKSGRFHLILLWLMLSAYAVGVVAWIRTDTTPPMWDQSIILKQSLHHYNLLKERPLPEAIWGIATGYDYYPPLVPFIAAVLYFAFGNSSDTAVFAILPFLGLLGWAVFALGRHGWGSGVGLLAVFLTLTSPMVIGLSREFLLDLPLTAMVVVSLYLLIRSRNLEDTRYSMVLGVACGLGMLTKWTFAFFVIGPLAVMVLWVFGNTWFRWKDRLLVSLGAAASMAAMVFIYSMFDAQARITAKFFLYAAAVVTGLVLLPGIWRPWGETLFRRAIPLIRMTDRTVHSQWLNLCRVFAIALILAGPWYLENISDFRSDAKGFAVHSGRSGGDPDPLSLPSVLFPFWSLINFQLFIPFGLLALTGILWALRAHPAEKDWAVLMAMFVSGYLILTLIPNKNPRYTLPLIPPALLLGSAWVVSRRPTLRISLIIGLVMTGLIQYGAVAYGYGMVHRTISLPLPKSSLTEFRGLPARMVVYSTAPRMYDDLDIYYSHPPLNEHWPLEEILQRVQEDSSEQAPVLVMAYFYRFLNSANLSYTAERLQSPIRVYDYRYDHFDREPHRWSGNHYLLTKMDDLIPAELEAVLSGEFPVLETRAVQTWRLPNQLVIQLLRIQGYGALSPDETKAGSS
jgi:4-amino-4-deoxy-L-arabinose transferase-like glycosyltransferase